MEACEYSIVNQEDSDRMVTSKWAKFRLLMWKNYLLQYRHPLQTILEIAIPVLFSALLVLVRSLVTPDIISNSTIYTPLPLNDIKDTLGTKGQLLFKVLSFNKNINISQYTNFSNEIVYSPKNDELEILMSHVGDFVKPFLRISSVPSSEKLAPYLRQQNAFVGVEFPDSYKNITVLPDDLKYDIRFPGELRRTGGAINPLFLNWRTDFLFPMFQPGGSRNYKDQHDGIPSGYYIEGFLFIQQFIFKSFMMMKNNFNFDLNQVPKINIRRFPHPPFVIDILLQGLQALIPLFILLSFVYPCINIIKYITTEKEKQLKEAMKIMGLDSWLHWIAWFAKCFIYMLITVTLMTILLKVQWYGKDNPNSVFTYSSGTVLWAFLLIYSITTIMFCFMLSVFFSKASSAAAVAGLVWFLIYSPYTLVQQRYDSISLVMKLLMSLLSNTAMSLGFHVILRYEGTQEGIQWHNIFQPVSIDDNFHLGYVIFMLIVDASIYLLIALYVEKIFPGEYGIAEPWNFPFTTKFWFNVTEYIGIQDSNVNGFYQINPNYEDEPKNKTAGIRIHGLRKVFDSEKIAVDSLTLNMYEDQITVLLGHNGAGKTTTMSMLTGMIPCTSGTAIVNGKDIRRDINAIRSSIGFCPQHNILFEDLTVREHIIFYSLLKGLNQKDVDREVEKYVKLLKLESKIDLQARGLSGGMKRKLSVGIALCANSKTVLFDEPSSGVDPGARRDLWDLLQQEKNGRTILLSTHFMLEADVLGDRIAIMSNGKLKAVGSPFFLKKQFGVGYHLVCAKKNAASDSSDVTKLLQKYIPHVKKESEIGTELSYLLDERHILVFQNMLQDLENNSEMLNIESYGISLTTLEEVFLKVGTDNSPDENDENKNAIKMNGTSNSHMIDDEGVNFYNYSDTLTLLKGPKLYINQFFALLQKKILNSWRNLILLIIQILIPISYVTITIVIVRSWGGNKDLPRLQLSLNTYQPTLTTVQIDTTAWSDSVENKIFENYRQQFADKPKDMSKLEVISGDMIEHYLEKADKELAWMNKRYLFGATIEKSVVTAWFNNQPYHTVPISLSLIQNAILKTICGSNCSITLSNKPLPYRAESRMMMLQAGNNLGFQLSFNIGFAMAFVASFFVIMYIKERVTKAKHLQFVSGVNALTYWSSAFVWDYIVFLIISLLTTTAIGVFQENGYSTFTQLGRIYLMLIMFGFAVLPFLYIAAFLFQGPASGFIKMSIFFIFFGTAMYTVVFSMRFEGFNLKDVADTLTWIFLIIPHFSLSNGLSNMNLINVFVDVCNQQCNLLGICEKEKQCAINPRCCNLDYFAWEEPGILRNIVYFILVGITAFAILFLIEFRVFEVLYYYIRMIYRPIIGLIAPNLIKRPPNSGDTVDDDEDVKREKEQINSMLASEYENHNLIMKNVSKYYKDFLAVNQLCIGIKAYECFGLLGVNGAGKTSTFKMLTGDAKISNGEAFVQGTSLKMHMKEVHQKIGYCPQFDALIDELTGRETLKLFAMSRGIPYYKLNDVIVKLSNDLNFSKHLDKQVKAYSGGNKRKLSTAVALLGNPVIIYLDEPTTGMDVGAKRNLWNVMCSVRNAGKTIVLTSHSMEECEALCTRLAIMVNGHFKCLGSTQHLKSKFGKGFVLTIKVKRASETPTAKDGVLTTESSEMINERNSVKDFVEQEFQGSVLKEEYYDLLTFHVPAHDIKWSEIFGTLENARKYLNIEDYSIAQSTLEQIFLLFTKYQRESDDK